MNVNDFLICCQDNSWRPEFLSPDSATLGEVEIERQIIQESQSALRQGQWIMALELINLALRSGLQSIELLQLKALALQKNKQKSEQCDQVSTISGQMALLALRGMCLKANWNPQFIPEQAPPEDINEFETLVIQEVETVRDSGNPQLALALADEALANGFTSLWLHHNRALAFAQLKQFEDAHRIWTELCQHLEVPDFVAVVQDAFEQSQQRERDLANRGALVLSDLHRLMAEAGWTTRHLPATSEKLSNEEMEFAILQEAETSRNNNEPQLSLQILDCAIQAGYESLWLLHNKALALTKLENYNSATEIWARLSTHKIDGFSENVKTELERNQKLSTIQQADILERAGKVDEAISKLVKSHFENPSHAKTKEKLISILEKHEKNDYHSPVITEAKDYFYQAKLNDLFLAEAHSRMKNHSKSTAQQESSVDKS